MIAASPSPRVFQPASKSPLEFMETMKRKERKEVPVAITVPFDDVTARLGMTEALLLSSKRLRGV